MRRLFFPGKTINGEQLEAELLGAGVPLPPSGAISIEAEGQIAVLVNVEPEDDTHDATVAAVIAAHTPPPPLTPRQRAAVVARQLIEAVEAGSAISRAIGRVFAKRDEALANWLNVLRQRCGAAGVNINGLPVLPVFTPADTLQQVKDELDLD